ncbi:alcohol dehydrogenase, putative [Phytophthora infestans T30-4]|uniref:Alcohol dehydrogenase, putative n=1 Tax=Phytophthora infestans (strain T30-4) TaxID=403677 RepID=D0MXS3_PHYIT|nr:alcohol dehydrogenase, putative [Phytophthora infestans T30-4]EEY65971.1 alcohol dehydrogenase, putative [Phytophthora infestans T30-4]|eukprot:XP_002906570.1 alcohol dehydrogenase, putative [Phytophthora infestans T30-4]
MAFPQTFRAYHASVNPIDYMLLEAVGQLFLGKTPSATEPFGIGFDAAGEIVEVGKDVKRLKVGDEVYAMTPFSAFGTLGEFSVVDEQFVATKPRNLSFDEAASAPLVALTAYQGMFEHAKLQKGETVLILGGSSSVGMYAIQFARAIGARVITTWLDEVEAHSVDAFYNCGVENAAWNEGAQVMLKQNTITILPMAQPIKEAEFGAHLIGQRGKTCD